uniref:Lipase domain-containing protein n=2 Tax=Stomoxys calcitrans TaxID=35570 RepID=A0A1I8PI98_STOCA
MVLSNFSKIVHSVLFVIFCADLCHGNPFIGLFDPKCVVVQGDCPHENVTFWLYTNQTQSTPLKLDPLNLSPELFQPAKPLYIVIHGYTGDRDYSPNSYIRPALLESQDVYVISVDYGPLVPYPCYFAAVENLPLASKCLGQLINNMVERNIVVNDDIHMIGFSLGAQVAGQTANYLNRRLKRITGLDPAKPMFITVGSERKLDATDAEFVDVIHTDVLGRGMLRSMGHVDFYPNMGPYQPGCRTDNMDDPGSCNHDRAPQYYAESIRNPEGFWSYACPSWLHNLFGLCNPYSNDEIMGHRVKRSASGSYFLRTNEKPPFAMGKQIAQSTKGHQPHALYDYNDLYDEGFEPQLRKAFVDWTDFDFLEFRKMSHFDERHSEALAKH